MQRDMAMEVRSRERTVREKGLAAMRVRCALLFGLALPLAGALRSAVGVRRLKMQESSSAAGVRRLKMQESSSPYPSPLPPQWKEILDPSSGKPYYYCLLYTSPSPRDATLSRMPSSA